MSEIGIFEAKTRLSELVRLVEGGQSFTITQRGRPVADLVPSRRKNAHAVAEAIRRLREMPKVEGIPGETVREWIEEGRE